MLSDFDGTQNFLLFTLDSCRWDTFESAHMPNLKSVCRFRLAFTQATYTYPAHLSIFSGQLPNTAELEPYYNRFAKYLFFLRGGNAQVDSYIEFPTGTPDIIRGFETIGYSTFGMGAVEWFNHPNLRSPFNKFDHTGIHLDKQVKLLLRRLESNRNTPFFGFINVGETHDPYEFGGRIVAQSRHASRMRSIPNYGFAEREYRNQISCCEFIDEKFAIIFEAVRSLKRKSVFIVCGDHGECFGEDGLYGHGFFHPQVMAVPLGIFEI